jgi:hypothetical protein
LAQAKVNHRWGLINRDGKFIVKPKYSRILRGNDTIIQVYDPESRGVGFIDVYGNTIIEPTLFWARNFSEGLCAVAVGKPAEHKWGFINRLGEMVIQAKFDSAWNFEEGFAPVKVGDKWGYIDRKGNFIWKPSN